MTENWHINSSRKDDRELKTIPTEKKQNSSIEIMQCKEDKKKDFDERKDYIHVVKKMIEVEKETIQKNPSAIIQKKKLDIEDKKKKGMIRKGIVKEMLEKIERQQSNSTLTNSKETLRKEIDIEKDIGEERNMIKKEKEDDSLVKKERTNNSPRNNDSLKEKINERLKSIEIFMTYTQDNGSVELAKKVEILNSPFDIDRERDIKVLNTTESSDNEKTDRHIRNTICHKCKQYGHTKK